MNENCKLCIHAERNLGLVICKIENRIKSDTTDICGHYEEMTVTNDEGEVIPATINGKKYESIVICPNCMGRIFGKGDEE